jgi:ketol-acid reductoisomerase
MTSDYKIAVLGYGSHGRAWAANLRDSGCDIAIGLRSRSVSRRAAHRDGFKNIVTISEAVKKANIIIFAFPDHRHGKVFAKDIKPYLKPGSTLVFLHGFSVHFKTIIPPKNCDLLLLAPLAPGAAVREKYVKKESVGYFHAIHQNGTGRAQAILNFLTRKMRIEKRALIRTTFADEAIGDIFGEQAVLCGGLSQLIMAGYDTMRAAGFSSDKAYLEVGYQIDLIVELIKKYGIQGMLERISFTARYGSIINGPKIIDHSVRLRMKKLLSEIKSGRFASELNSITKEKISKSRKVQKKLSSPAFEKSARKFSPLKKRQ